MRIIQAARRALLKFTQCLLTTWINLSLRNQKKVNEDKTFWIDNQVKKARNKNRLISFFLQKIDGKKKKDFYQNKLQTQAAKNKQDFFSID